MLSPIRMIGILLLTLLPWSALADDLTQRLDALTLEVQLGAPDSYAHLDKLGPQIQSATPLQQMRWHVLRCESAAGSRSLSEVQQVVRQGLALAERLQQPQLAAYMNACESSKLMTQGQYEQALDSINRAIHDNSAYGALGISLLRRADIYADQGNLEAALDDLYQALTWLESTHDYPPLFQPHPAMLSYSLARTYYYLGDYLRSDTLFEQAVREAPSDSVLSWVIRVNQTFTLMQQQRFIEASQQMESLDALVPNMSLTDQAHFNLLYAHLSLKLDRFAKGYQYAELAISQFGELGMDERQARARGFLAESAFHLERFEDARYHLKLARERYRQDNDIRVLADLDRIESEGEALQGHFQKAYQLQLSYQKAYAGLQEQLRKDALLQQQAQLDQRIDRSRERLAAQSEEYFKLHNKLMIWQVIASLSLLLWLIWLLFKLTSNTGAGAGNRPLQSQDWRSQLEHALATTDRTLPVVQFNWEGPALSELDRKRILSRDLRINDIMLEPGDHQLLMLLVDASEAEAERLRYRLSRSLAEAGYLNITTGVARSHPLDRSDSLLARLECNQIQHSLMRPENIIRPNKPQWHR
ncbi:Tetratricopeptide repeat-containing protein [Ferrimonas sediminum]|uniref:Tetratricopeptide repeat-containing protein n=1 Tax=Ferrimonas sediminum TaxID=718193 RepID=A0A1G8JWY7_9GAMM|nr:tetratricopeptide repeat protein [Ferrimonas sediminum]SDI35120.1 Tetratricopeptide repeat-containing protein [Ferrimonas sediminum]